MIRRLKNYYHLGNAAFSSTRYKFPGRKLTVIGITGTDGKTTTSTMLYSILMEAKIKAALITTIGAYVDGNFYETGLHTTTPSSRVLQKYLGHAYKSGCTHVVLEITSHGLDQNRAWGIPFFVGIITNITREHLDYHKTYEKYVHAKAKLLRLAKTPIINADDQSYEYLLKELKGKAHITYSINDSALLPAKMKLIGEFNRQNALAAATAAQFLGIEKNIIKKAISEFTPPEGRQEVIHDDEFKVIVDFAHTPNAFYQVLPAVKKETKGRLIHVFGAAGKRDASKRPDMGRASSLYADVVILTAEDPRGESVVKINQEIKSGFEKKVLFYEIADRRAAIKKALETAKKGDIVLLTGKGHEKSINYDGSETAWSEKETVFEFLR